MRISHWVVLLPVLAGPAFAQVTAPNCTVSGWDWTSNSLGQSPCYVAASLESTCDGGQFTIPPLPSGSMYAGPYGGQSNTCICSTVVYSLVSACGGCQGSTWIPWNMWSFNCTSVDTVYPNAIPTGTRVPHWAYLELPGTNGTWDAAAAQFAGDSPEVTPSPVSTTRSSQTAAASLSTSKSHTGAIAGGVVGGLLGASLLIGTIFCYLRRRRSRAEPEPILDVDNQEDASGALGAQARSPLMGRYYDPSDPSTYPRSLASPSTSAAQITQPFTVPMFITRPLTSPSMPAVHQITQPFMSPSMSAVRISHDDERGHGGRSINTRYKYKGLPLV